ncbi:MAG: winged helix-turn-helix domain-containing protein [Inquilinaceae bacterium]
MTLVVTNAESRRLFLHLQGLSQPPRTALGRDGLRTLIERLGFVQIDSIATVERAHHQILFSRNQTYRQRHLVDLHERQGAVFENWTHDAAIIPTAYFPFWRHRFARERARLKERWGKWRRDGFEEMIETVLDRIDRHGPTMARDLAPADGRTGTGWWDWHPAKTALEYLWRTGEVAVVRRDGFQKVYDLTARAIPGYYRDQTVSTDAFVDWACQGALDRLGFATPGEIASFWDAVSPAEAKAWVAAQGDRLRTVRIETANGSGQRLCFARPDIADHVDAAPPPPARLRVLSPFDPLLRDRARAERLFGFRYRIEVFVPQHKRTYGYYVFPLLEGDRMVGRIDMKIRRAEGTLAVRRLWLEPGIRLSAGREARLAAELARVARFAGADRVDFADGWRGDGQ